MKAKLHRGPWHNKTVLVPEHQEYIVFAKPDKMSAEVYYPGSNLRSPVHMEIEKHVYRRTRHTHPNGSVFFEWSGK